MDLVTAPLHYITPPFSQTHVNFKRVPVVDTSDPFIARDIPTLDESLLITSTSNSTASTRSFLTRT